MYCMYIYMCKCNVDYARFYAIYMYMIAYLKHLRVLILYKQKIAEENQKRSYETHIFSMDE